jgi:hypothetical protein
VPGATFFGRDPRYPARSVRVLVVLSLALAACVFDPKGYDVGEIAADAAPVVEGDASLHDALPLPDGAEDVVDAAVPDAAPADAAPPDAGAADAGAPDAAPPPACPASYTPLGSEGHAYRYYAAGRRWPRAEERCAGDGTHLLVLDAATLAENQAELDLVRPLLPDGTFQVWIGVSDRVSENLWRAVTGATVLIDALPWLSGEPNDFFSAEDCVELTATGLNDAACGLQRAYVCECDGLPEDPDAF